MSQVSEVWDRKLWLQTYGPHLVHRMHVKLLVSLLNQPKLNAYGLVKQIVAYGMAAKRHFSNESMLNLSYDGAQCGNKKVMIGIMSDANSTSAWMPVTVLTSVAFELILVCVMANNRVCYEVAMYGFPRENHTWPFHKGM